MVKLGSGNLSVARPEFAPFGWSRALGRGAGAHYNWRLASICLRTKVGMHVLFDNMREGGGGGGGGWSSHTACPGRGQLEPIRGEDVLLVVLSRSPSVSHGSSSSAGTLSRVRGAKGACAGDF